jgi:hypothetical protein
MKKVYTIKSILETPGTAEPVVTNMISTPDKERAIEIAKYLGEQAGNDQIGYYDYDPATDEFTIKDVYFIVEEKTTDSCTVIYSTK